MLGREGAAGGGWQGDGLASPSPENAEQLLLESSATNIWVSSIKKAEQKAELELPSKTPVLEEPW